MVAHVRKSLHASPWTTKYNPLHSDKPSHNLHMELIAVRSQRSPHSSPGRSLSIRSSQNSLILKSAAKGTTESPVLSIDAGELREECPQVKSTSRPASQFKPAAAPQRVEEISPQRDRSPRLEALINRCQSQSNSYIDLLGDCRSQTQLEYLAVAQRSDKGFQIILSGTCTPLVKQIFATIHHCHEAATELEEMFDLGFALQEMDDLTREMAEAIAQAHVLREQVELEFEIC